jgi:hypothetical protein
VARLVHSLGAMRFAKRRVALCSRPRTASPPVEFSLLAREFPQIDVELPPQRVAAIEVIAADWRDPTFDLWAFDRAMDRAIETSTPTIVVVGPAAELPSASLEVLTRCQRVIPRRNPESATRLFDAVLERHRALHDLSRPLVQADFDHALDVWQWVLRLAPGAPLAVQLAALFHDVERLVSESERRIEQLATDYQGFKDRHAAQGAELAAARLREVGVPESTVREVTRLIATHERPSTDRNVALLNDADALSFFSLNSAGFADYYDHAHTRMKVAYSWRRLGRRARRYLDCVRLRPDLRALVEAASSAGTSFASP